MVSLGAFVFQPPIKTEICNRVEKQPSLAWEDVYECLFTPPSSKSRSSSHGIIPEGRDEEWERKVAACHSPHPSAALNSTSQAGNEAGDTHWPRSHLPSFGLSQKQFKQLMEWGRSTLHRTRALWLPLLIYDESSPGSSLICTTGNTGNSGPVMLLPTTTRRMLRRCLFICDPGAD